MYGIGTTPPAPMDEPPLMMRYVKAVVHCLNWYKRGVCVCGSECSLCHYLPIAVIPRLSWTWTYDFNVTVRVQTNAHANNYPVSVQES